MKRPRVFPQRSQVFRFFVFLPTLLAIALSSSSVFGRCGVQRWDVKTGTDSQATSISLTSPTPTTIAFLTDLARFPAPAHWPPPSRIAPEETTLWILDATLDSYKFENDPNTGDSDYHLFIKDDAGNTMVAEIPFPGCTPGSVWTSQIAAARATFDSQFTATGSFKSAQSGRMGFHSDVGGSYPESESGLSKLALEWMVKEAIAAGLLIDPRQQAKILGGQPGFTRPDPYGPMHNSLRGLWLVLEILPHRYYDGRFDPPWRWKVPLGRRRYIAEKSIVAESALARMSRSDLKYDPSNVPDDHMTEPLGAPPRGTQP